MKIKDRKTGEELDATREEDGSYTVAGQKLTKEEMSVKYMPVKPKPKEKPKEAKEPKGKAG